MLIMIQKASPTHTTVTSYNNNNRFLFFDWSFVCTLTLINVGSLNATSKKHRNKLLVEKVKQTIPVAKMISHKMQRASIRVIKLLGPFKP